MIKAKDIFGQVERALRYTTAADKASVRPACQMAYERLCELIDWPLLRQKTTISFGSNGDPEDLPDGTIDVTAVQGADDVYWYAEEPEAGLSDGLRKWAYSAKTTGDDPDETRQMILRGEDGSAADDEVTVYLWVYPPRLEEDEQIVLLPAARPLVLATIVDILGLQDKQEAAADRYRNEYQAAIQDALALVPKPAPVGARVTRNGKPLRRGPRG
jgi:hypothetical protein